MRTIVTKEMEQEILKDFYSGIEIQELGIKYNIQKQTIQKHLKKFGISFSNKIPLECIDLIINDYCKGKKISDLSQNYNIPQSSIICMLKRKNVYQKIKNTYSDTDIEFIKNKYEKKEWNLMFEKYPGITKNAIYSLMSKNNVKIKNYYWTEDDVEKLKLIYNDTALSKEDLEKAFNFRFSYNAIVSKANKLGIKKRDYWSNEEIFILEENYSNKTIDEMLPLLPKRNRNTIIEKAKKLNLKNKTYLDMIYTDDEKKFINENYNKMTDSQIALILKRSPSSINNYRCNHGLLKDYDISKYGCLSNYIRKSIYDWKIKSIKNCNYRCVLTGDRFDVVHHIYGFNLILEETLNDLSIELKDNLEDYSTEELILILEYFKKTQNKYPLGVCLTNDIHKIFHSIYGYGFNTIKQWDKFCLDYKNGIYKNYNIA